jgi:predicted acetyltransferase
VEAPNFVVVDQSNRATLDRLWQLYKHDLSEFRDSHPNSEGLFVTRRGIDVMLADGGHEAFLIYIAEQLVGIVIAGGLNGDVRDISEFFIIRSKRRNGVGALAAEATLTRFPGRWHIVFQEENPGAAAFWRRIAPRVSNDSHSEERRQQVEKPHIPPDVWMSLEV